MEQITCKDDKLYYGTVRCSTPNAAYLMFRCAYHDSIGRDANRKLNREGQRTDVIHWEGFTLSDSYYEELHKRFGEDFGNVSSSVIGISCTSYCRTIDCTRLEEVDEDVADLWIDWTLSDKSKVLRLMNRKNGLGRTNKRTNKNYR